MPGLTNFKIKVKLPTNAGVRIISGESNFDEKGQEHFAPYANKEVRDYIDKGTIAEDHNNLYKPHPTLSNAIKKIKGFIISVLAGDVVLNISNEVPIIGVAADTADKDDEDDNVSVISNTSVVTDTQPDVLAKPRQVVTPCLEFSVDGNLQQVDFNNIKELLSMIQGIEEQLPKPKPEVKPIIEKPIEQPLSYYELFKRTVYENRVNIAMGMSAAAIVIATAPLLRKNTMGR